MLITPKISPILHTAVDVVPFPATSYAIFKDTIPQVRVAGCITDTKIYEQLVIWCIIGIVGIFNRIPGVIENLGTAMVVSSHDEPVCIAKLHESLGFRLMTCRIIDRIRKSVGEVAVKVHPMCVKTAAINITIRVIDRTEPDFHFI